MKPFIAIGLVIMLSGLTGGERCNSSRQTNTGVPHPSSSPQDRFARQRQEMVQQQIADRDVKDRRVLDAMRKVPRHRFVLTEYLDEAYSDYPLPIGYNQTISQPYIVAFMTEALRLKGNERVLEVGTGSGYQAAVLAETAAEVYSIEIVQPLAERAEKLLKELDYHNVTVRFGDGYQGWPEHAPFDAIIVTAAPDHIPKPLVEQLRIGGRMVIPVGVLFQELLIVEKTEKGVHERSVLPVRFVPMTGAAQKKKP